MQLGAARSSEAVELFVIIDRAMRTPKFIQKRLRKLKRYARNKAPIFILAAALFLISAVSYASYMSTRRLSVNPESYTQLLNLIAKVESNGNYNAYYGDARNSDIDFTAMSISDVMKWQKDFVAQGSPSSAVGRYQILSGTLESLVAQMGLSSQQTFDERTQDAMAIALLERRGAVEYVNLELSDKDFAANLAKEWAALPKVIGDNPEQSYYAGDGLNKSRVESKEVLNAIKPIEAN